MRNSMVITPSFIAALLGIACAAALVLGGCATTQPAVAAWKSSSQTLKNDVEVIIPANGTPEADGSVPFTMKGDLIKGAVIEGTARQDAGTWTLAMTGMKWFSNWSDGWTEAHFVLEGSAVLTQTNGVWKLTVAEMPALDVPDSARIRFYDSYSRDTEALRRISNRWDRIVAAVAWLHEQLPGAWFDRASPDFSTAVQQKLFPEVYGWEKSAPPTNGPKVVAESVLWDTDFTKQHFPERLRAVRDSGTLLRDWEESVDLWYLAFCWDALWKEKLPSAIFELHKP